MDRELISYLPKFLQEYREIQILMKQEQNQAENLWNSIDKMWENQYIDELDSDGCERWERMLGYKPKDTFTLEERRKLIHSKTLQDRTGLDKVLNGLLGEDGYKAEVRGNHLIVRIKLGNKNMLLAVKKMLEEVKPAGMVMELIVMYNTYEMLKPYKYQKLKNYTYKQLREDVSIGKEYWSL